MEVLDTPAKVRHALCTYVSADTLRYCVDALFFHTEESVTYWISTLIEEEVYELRPY